MIFSSVIVQGFRNLADGEVDTQGKDIFLVGENGQGKTNFLEALYYCSYASSFRGARDQELVRFGEKNMAVSVTLRSPEADGTSRIAVKYERGKKTIGLDGKLIQDRKELLSINPCIVFCHEDLEFVSGSPESRRWFFDQTNSLYDPAYLDDLRRYRRLLKTRNFTLKSPNAQDRELLESLDPQLIYYGLNLMRKREEAARYFSGIFEALYREVSGIEGIETRYTPSWKDNSPIKIEKFLLERREQEARLGISLSGPHRDQYRFLRKGVDFTQTASMGQRRLLALALRVAQSQLFSQMTGRNPVLLLDDALLELDPEKKRKFLEVMPAYDQAFYAFLPGEPFERFRKKDTLVYQVSQGTLTLDHRAIEASN